MTQQPGHISPVKYLPADVELEPVYIALNSLSLLNLKEQLPALPPWIKNTAEALTAEQHQTNRLVFEGLGYALTPMRAYHNFSVYLDELAATDPVTLRNHLLSCLTAPLPGPLEYGDIVLSVDTASLLGDVHTYITHIKHLNPALPLDLPLQQRVHRLLQEPEALQETLVSHLRLMWKATLAPEWKRALRSLQAQVTTYKKRCDPSATTLELFRLFTGRDLLTLCPLQTADVTHIILAPTPHNGRYVTRWLSAGTLHLFFTPPANFEQALHPPTMEHQELHACLKSLADALADETRLHILELFVQHEELVAQELMDRLDISQSSASRHLKQLVQAGYLLEKREGANKIYTFNALNFDSAIRALEQLKAGITGIKEPDTNTYETVPRELKRFVDAQGRVTMWPSTKQKEKLFILKYLVTNFEPGQVYSEKEVNELLTHYITFRDSISLRRELIDHQLLIRTADGLYYQRV
ncbi:MAG TPA: metalloregulator ArsR/SmtB family transcription factor [Ktedonobacteraceae bacterium]